MIERKLERSFEKVTEEIRKFADYRSQKKYKFEVFSHGNLYQKDQKQFFSLLKNKMRLSEATLWSYRAFPRVLVHLCNKTRGFDFGGKPYFVKRHKGFIEVTYGGLAASVFVARLRSGEFIITSTRYLARYGWVKALPGIDPFLKSVWSMKSGKILETRKIFFDLKETQPQLSDD